MTNQTDASPARLSMENFMTNGIKARLQRYGVAKVFYPVDHSWVRHISKETGCYYKYDDENRTLWFATEDMARKGADILNAKDLLTLTELNSLAFVAMGMERYDTAD